METRCRLPSDERSAKRSCVARHANISGYEDAVAPHCKALVTPHAYNLRHQAKVVARKNTTITAELERIVPSYCEFVDTLLRFDYGNLEASARVATAALETYLALVMSSKNEIFKSQSDFRTSIVPEFFLRLLDGYIQCKSLPFTVIGQTSIPIDIAFDLKREGLIVKKLQRVDVAVVKPVILAVDGIATTGFSIPLVAAEVKNYFDKNMISGVEFSVATLKSTFPHCAYFAISEFADFELQSNSYASSEIDEIYILRKQKRADFRKSDVAKPLDRDLIIEILNRFFVGIETHLAVHHNLKLRVPNGRLIRGNPTL